MSTHEFRWVPTSTSGYREYRELRLSTASKSARKGTVRLPYGSYGRRSGDAASADRDSADAKPAPKQKPASPRKLRCSALHRHWYCAGTGLRPKGSQRTRPFDGACGGGGWGDIVA